MKDTEYAFAVAKIRANENKLLSASAIDSAISADGYDEAVKILIDAGLKGLEENDADTALSLRMSEAFSLIYEAAPDKKCLDFLIVKNDFHNIKALVKGLVASVDTRMLLVSPTVLDAELVIRAVNEKKFQLLPPMFSKPLSEAYGVLTKTLDGQMAEIILDRACLEASVALAKELDDKFAVTLSERMAVLTNVKIALRAIKTGKDKAFLEMSLADVLNKSRLIDAAIEGLDSFKEYVSFMGFEQISMAIDVSYAAFEKQIDDKLLECVKNAKYTSFGISPLAAYYFAVDSETKTVRIILSCKKNGISSDIIRERVRELYV